MELYQWVGDVEVSEAFVDVADGVPDKEKEALQRCLPDVGAHFSVAQIGQDAQATLNLTPTDGFSPEATELVRGLHMCPIPQSRRFVNLRERNEVMPGWSLQCVYGESHDMSSYYKTCQLSFVCWWDASDLRDPSYIIVRWVHKVGG